jgi:hypothetical protein
MGHTNLDGFCEHGWLLPNGWAQILCWKLHNMHNDPCAAVVTYLRPTMKMCRRLVLFAMRCWEELSHAPERQVGAVENIVPVCNFRNMPRVFLTLNMTGSAQGQCEGAEL